MNIVCVMPIYKRQPITIKTLELLKQQSLPIRIVTVGSTNIDKDSASKAGVEYLQHPNRPLSNKWQAGIYYARKYDPDAIMICGSDAWLTTNWCEVAHKYILDGFDMVGKRDFYTSYVVPGQKLAIIGRTYKTRKDPVGSGRLISKNILDKLDWSLYPTGLNSCMDGASYKRLKAQNFKLKVITDYDDMVVMSIKSPLWETITSYNHVRDNPMFVSLSKIGDKRQWLDKYFPNAVSDFEDIAPGIVI